nr:TerB N-terminal domain-containing protein [Deinococcus metallilatus]
MQEPAELRTGEPSFAVIDLDGPEPGQPDGSALPASATSIPPRPVPVGRSIVEVPRPPHPAAQAGPVFPRGVPSSACTAPVVSSGVPVRPAPPAPASHPSGLRETRGQPTGADRSPPVKPTLPSATRGRWERLQRQHAPRASFLWETRQRVNESRDAATPVPLLAYWVTYASLDRAQTDWYLFWRARFRAGEPLPTDLSYIFLHVYETLHGVGFNRPEAAFAHLQRLWRSYRVDHPQLDHHLVDWLADFIRYYDLDDEVTRAWLDEAWVHAHGDLAVHYWLERGGGGEVPEGVFQHLISYRPEQNKFYRDAEDKAALDTLLRRAVVLTDSFYRETTGESVFERLKTKATHTVERRAFSGAVFEGPDFQYTVATIRQYRQDGRLSKLLTQAVRHAENLARKQVGFRSLLRDVKLPANLAAYLDVHLAPALATLQPPSPVQTPPAPERPRVQLDLGRLATLQQESEQVRGRLLEETEPGEASTDLEPSISPAVPATPALPAAPLAAVHRPPLPAQVAEGELTEVDSIAEVLAGITDAARDLLRQLRNQGWEAPEGDLRLPPGVFTSTLVDEVNEAAQPRLGDVLLQQQDGRLVAVDDYRNELAFLLGTPEPAALTPPLDGPWGALAGLLSPLHLEVLAQLLQTDLTLGELEVFTTARHALGSAVLEDLNSHALDTVGDILVDPYGDPLTLEDAYRDDVRRVLHASGLVHPE